MDEYAKKLLKSTPESKGEKKYGILIGMVGWYPHNPENFVQGYFSHFLLSSLHIHSSNNEIFLLTRFES
jgi:hypothetical protein